MSPQNEMDRRDFLRLAGLGAAAWAAGRMDVLAPADAATTAGRALLARRSSGPDVDLVLRAVPSSVRLFSGTPTRVWTYQASLVRGRPGSLQTLPNNYLGPIVRVRRGQTVRVHFVNELPGKSIIHWHGLRVPPAMDGHPRDAVAPGGSYTYDFPVLNRAGTYWFHPHPDGLAGPQVYYGLAGLFLVSDDEEEAAGLPTGPYDVPLVIQDRTFDRTNQLVYQTGDMMMDRTMGFLGDRILVNGQPDYSLGMATRPYRLRLLNGSNSRIYKLAWSDGTPLTVIGTDGGLLAAPVSRDYVTLAPGERVDLWADFSSRSVGTTLKLLSLGFSGVEGNDGMMGGGMGGGSGMGSGPMPNGAPFPVLTVQV